MSLNWAEIDLVLQELSLPDSFVQEVIQTDFRNLYLSVFRSGDPFFLRICLETGRTRMHRAVNKPHKPSTRQRFAQLLHARVRGARIEATTQLNRDRIVRIDLSRADEALTLWIRLWGGASNIILTDSDSVIIDAFFRRPKRGEMTNERFHVEQHELTEPEIERSNRFLPRWTTDLNSTVADHYRRLELSEAHAQILAQARRLLENQSSAAEHRKRELENKLSVNEEPDRLRHLGDLLYAWMHTISPGQSWVELADYNDENRSITVQLDNERTPQQNADLFYERARKSERRKTALLEEIANLEGRIGRYTEQLQSLDSLSPAQLHELVDQERPPERGRPQENNRPGLAFLSHSFTILVGRNSRENDALLRRHTRGNDTWLHTRDYPGGYVFVRAQKGKTVPLPVLLDAGMLAIHFSKAKSNGRADLYYTQVKYLRRAKDGPPGLVLPTHEKNLHVQVDETRLSRLLR